MIWQKNRSMLVPNDYKYFVVLLFPWQQRFMMKQEKWSSVTLPELYSDTE